MDVDRVAALEAKLKAHTSHWKAVAEMLDVAAVIIVAVAIIGVTHKTHVAGTKNIQDEVKLIELSMHREKNATIVAVCLVILAWFIKLYLHFK